MHLYSEKKQKHPHYERRVFKLDLKNSYFTAKKFQRIRKISMHKKLIKSFSQIGMCLNDRDLSNILDDKLDKVCFILINAYTKRNHDLGVGPLNDGYLVGLNHYRLGYKIFYLYDPRREDFISKLGFFFKNTQKELTVFYSGRDTIVTGIHGIEFFDGALTKSTICDIISKNYNPNLRAMFISDCCSGGSVFDISLEKLSNCNIISFYVQKESSPESKDGKMTHGIFTFYFFKITSDKPNITPNNILEQINPSLERFHEKCSYEMTNKELAEKQIFCK